MLRARHLAFQKSRTYFVTVASNSYLITEDTNESAGSAPDAADTPLWTAPKQLRYQPYWTGTVILEGRGTIKKSTGGILSNNPLSIRFDANGAEPEYDCISVAPTRINAGKWNGTKCLPR